MKTREEPVVSGVPQGSVIGPVFIIFINDMESVVCGSNAGSFSDGRKITKRIASVVDHVVLQEDLGSIISWSKRNNMELHEQKFELMIHEACKGGSGAHEMPFRNQLYTYEISDDVTLSSVDELRDLGVTMSADLSWDSHIGKVVSRGRSSAFWVMSVFGSREEEVMMTFYKSFVRSQLEYCSLLWHPQKIGDIELIEGVQRTFTSKISAVSQFDYWERLRKLKLMSLQRRRERFIIIWMFRCRLGEVPNDLGIEFRSPGRLGIKAVVPPLSINGSNRAQSKYDESFAVIGPKLWNVLPADVSVMNNPRAFKRVLTEWCLKRPDRPPVAGYRRLDDNSLLSVYRLSI